MKKLLLLAATTLLMISTSGVANAKEKKVYPDGQCLSMTITMYSHELEAQKEIFDLNVICSNKSIANVTRYATVNSMIGHATKSDKRGCFQFNLKNVYRKGVNQFGYCPSDQKTVNFIKNHIDANSVFTKVTMYDNSNLQLIQLD